MLGQVVCSDYHFFSADYIKQSLGHLSKMLITSRSSRFCLSIAENLAIELKKKIVHDFLGFLVFLIAPFSCNECFYSNVSTTPTSFISIVPVAFCSLFIWSCL